MKKNFFLVIAISISLQSCSSENNKDDEQSVKEKAEVRAVWVPDPAHTQAMITYRNVLNTVKLLDELNFNAIYLCVWARSQTAFKSQVLLNHSNYVSKEEGYLFNNFMNGYNLPQASPSGDPVKDLITEAHKKGIKVIFWFEYGFMASNGLTPANNPILSKNSTWLGKANNGKQSNDNGTDYYFNGYDPTVQEFMLSLIEESISFYPEVDGIQCDDRMPAMPRNSGYDDYTVSKYKAEHNGATPPDDFNNPAWVRWRLDILNNFGEKMYKRIKAKKADAVVCFSPNPYPWCEENLMQEWTQWIECGIVDILSVQCYRNDIASYTSTIQTARRYIREKTNKSIFNPGIILKNGSKIMPEDLLTAQLKANRDINTDGEAYFYIDGLNDLSVQKVIKAFYKDKAAFK